MSRSSALLILLAFGLCALVTSIPVVDTNAQDPQDAAATLDALLAPGPVILPAGGAEADPAMQPNQEANVDPAMLPKSTQTEPIVDPAQPQVPVDSPEHAKPEDMPQPDHEASELVPEAERRHHVDGEVVVSVHHPVLDHQDSESTPEATGSEGVDSATQTDGAADSDSLDVAKETTGILMPGPVIPGLDTTAEAAAPDADTGSDPAAQPTEETPTPESTSNSDTDSDSDSDSNSDGDVNTNLANEAAGLLMPGPVVNQPQDEDEATAQSTDPAAALPTGRLSPEEAKEKEVDEHMPPVDEPQQDEAQGGVGHFRHSCKPSIVDESSEVRAIGAKQAEVSLNVDCGECGDHSHCPDTDFTYYIHWGDRIIPKHVSNGHLLQLHKTHTYKRAGRYVVTVHYCSKATRLFELPGCDAISREITVN